MRAPSRALLVAVLLAVLAAGPAHAEGREARDTGRVVFDALVLRPLSFIQVVVSAAMLPVFWPAAAPFGVGHEVVEICITQPVERTFRRPLGDL